MRDILMIVPKVAFALQDAAICADGDHCYSVRDYAACPACGSAERIMVSTYIPGVHFDQFKLTGLQIR